MVMFDIVNKESKNMTCAIHGDYISHLRNYRDIDRWSPCAECTIERMKLDTMSMIREGSLERAQNASKSLLNRVAVPLAFAECTFDNYTYQQGSEQHKVFNHCKYFADNFAIAIDKNKHGIFQGKSGTGKTHLSVAIIKRVLEQGYSAMFVTLEDMFLSIKDTFNNKELRESKVIKSFIDVDLLVIDECAITAHTTVLEKLFSVIGGRYNGKKPTIILTNEVERLEERIGSRAYSRLKQSKFEQNFNWDDYRLKGDK
jgi:DNA replication protein DnaC